MKIIDIPRSGSYHNIVSSHNRAGQYVRNRRTPINSPSARRTFIRSLFGAASSAWSALTPTVQASWIAAADAHPVVDRLGQSIKLTGHQMYVSVYTALSNSSAAPSPPDVPADFAVFSVSGSSGVFSIVSGLTLDLAGAGSALDFQNVSLSRPVPGGRTFWRQTTQRAVVAGNGTTYVLPTPAYAAQFGSPSVGQKVFATITPVSQYGVTGVPLVLPIVVTA